MHQGKKKGGNKLTNLFMLSVLGFDLNWMPKPKFFSHSRTGAHAFYGRVLFLLKMTTGNHSDDTCPDLEIGACDGRKTAYMYSHSKSLKKFIMSAKSFEIWTFHWGLYSILLPYFSWWMFHVLRTWIQREPRGPRNYALRQTKRSIKNFTHGRRRVRKVNRPSLKKNWRVKI